MRPNGPAGMVYAYPQSLQNSRQIGPAGRTRGSGGEFAAAASEVKARATQTARSTEEIGHRIGHVRSFHFDITQRLPDMWTLKGQP
jgi:hypothetical protein